MTVSKNTLFFAVFVFAGYQLGFTLAYRFYPSVLMLVMFPAWMAAIGFAFITLPIAWIHSAIVGCFIGRSSVSRNVGGAFLGSTLIAFLASVGFIWIGIASVDASFGGTGMLAPDGDAFRLPNAHMNLVLKYGITFFFAAWCSTLLSVRETARNAHDVMMRNSAKLS